MKYLIPSMAIAMIGFLTSPAQAQLEQIRMLPGTPDYTDALGGGGSPMQFSDGTLAITYKIQTDYSVNDEGPDRLYIVTSSDGGDTWSAPRQIDISENHQGIGGISTAVSSDGRALISYFNDRFGGTMLYSDDNGNTWTRLENAPDLGWGGTDLTAGPDGGFAVSYLASGNNRDVLWIRTSADGLAWSAPVKVVDINDTYLCGTTIGQTGEMDLIVLYYDCFFGSGLRPLMQVSSSDGGATWSAPGEALTSQNSFGKRMDATVADDGTVWLLHTNDEDLSYTYSDDDGATWAASMPWTDNTGMGNGPGDLDQDFQPALTMFDDQPFAVLLARRGNDWFHLFYGIPGVSTDPLTTSTFDVIAEGPGITLENNPNPFSRDTEIYFELEQPEQVRLSIFNSFGQEIARPVDGKIGATEHSVSWDAADMPAGVYYATLQTGTMIQTRAMMVAEAR